MATTRNVKKSFNIELPMELIFDILSRVPVEPLVRFKSVCKSWHALIQNPNFIKTQLTTSGQNKLSVLCVDIDDHTQSFSFYLHSNEKTRNLTSNPNFLFKTPLYILGICNGLVCAMLDLCDSKFIICNPTIGWLRKVPPFNLPRTRSQFVEFVFQDNDYKLCRILYSCVREEETLIVRGEVYSMNSDSWSNVEVKNVEVDSPLDTKITWCHPDYLSTPLAINEVLYWVTLACVDYNKFSCVAYFDMKRKVFGLIHLLGGDLTHKRLQLVDLKGKLALVIISFKRFELWVCNEKKRSWTMIHRTEEIHLNEFSLECLGCDKNDKLVMKVTSRGGKLTLFTYDQETCEIIYLPFSWSSKYPIFKHLYTESLLSFDT